MDPGRMKVVMLPWLAFGHISPFVDLAKFLSKRNFHIYICSTAVNLSSIREKLGAADNDDAHAIEVIEFKLTPETDLLPHHHTTKGLPPHLFNDLIKAYDMSGPNFGKILDTLKVDLIIYDAFQSWLPALAASRQIQAIHFQIVGALSTAVFHRNFNTDPSIICPPIIADESNLSKIASNWSKNEPCVGENSACGFDLTKLVYYPGKQSSDILLLRSSRAIEDKYIEYLSLLMEKKIVLTGPLVDVNNSHAETENDHVIMSWLSKKGESSTVYVSFGTECYLSDVSLRELAHGLELSNVNFIWVIRFPRGEEECRIEDKLPEGFVDRVKDRGMILSWAPQQKIFGHSSIGGYVSHCGWGSLIESLSFGIPIIAMPMQYDHPLCARLVEEIGVGVEVEGDESGQYKRDGIAKAIKMVVVEKSGHGVRNKAREMSEDMRLQGEKDMDCMVEELTKLCKKKKKQVD